MSKKNVKKVTTSATVEPAKDSKVNNVAATPAVAPAAPVQAAVAAVQPAVTEQPKQAATKSTKAAKAVKKGGKRAVKKQKAEVVAAAPVAGSPATSAGDATATATDAEGGKKKKRFFKCLYNGVTQGRYSGDKPKQAANKAFTNIVRHFDGNPIGVPITFEIVECTRGHQRKCSKYSGVRTELSKPLTIPINKDKPNSKQITYKYYNKIVKVKEVVAATGGATATPAAPVAAPVAQAPVVAAQAAPAEAAKPAKRSKKPKAEPVADAKPAVADAKPAVPVSATKQK